MLLASIAVLALAAAACGDDTSSTDTDPGTSAPSDTTTPLDTAAPDEESMDVDASVYFVQAVTEPAAGGVVDAIAATGRLLEGGQDAPELAALGALLDGPDAFETEIGFTSAIPDTTTLRDMTIEEGTATVDFDAAFEEASGAFTDVLRVAQVVFTLTAFDRIDHVRFEIDGEARDTIGTHGVDVTGADGSGMTRDDLPEARPPILVEAPIPGEELTDPLVVRGEANTFEANVLWSLTDPDGEILDEGFTTATAGSGTWGTFEFSVPLAAVDRGGLGSLILWETSAEDGRQTNIVEVPVAWPAP